MTAEDTSPDLFPPIPPEPGETARGAAAEAADTDGAEEARESRLRPLDRRILQALALLCAVPVLLAVHWVDEVNNIEKNLKPPEKTVTVPPDGIGELVGARWKVMKRETARPLAGGAEQQGDVTELRLAVGVRPGDAASAKAIGSYGLVYRLVDGEGREWSAAATTAGRQPRAGVASLITVKGTVPRAKAESLELEIQAPKTSRQEGEPLLSLRFAQ